LPRARYEDRFLPLVGIADNKLARGPRAISGLLQIA
jgi:hypothetical protein